MRQVCSASRHSHHSEPGGECQAQPLVAVLARAGTRGQVGLGLRELCDMYLHPRKNFTFLTYYRIMIIVYGVQFLFLASAHA